MYLASPKQAYRTFRNKWEQRRFFLIKHLCTRLVKYGNHFEETWTRTVERKDGSMEYTFSITVGVSKETGRI